MRSGAHRFGTCEVTAWLLGFLDPLLVNKVAERIRLVSMVVFIFKFERSVLATARRTDRVVTEDLFQILLQISALHELVAGLGCPLQRIWWFSDLKAASRRWLGALPVRAVCYPNSEGTGPGRCFIRRPQLKAALDVVPVWLKPASVQRDDDEVVLQMSALVFARFNVRD